MRAKVKEEEAEGGDDGRRREGCSRQRAARLSSSPSSPASRWKIRERERRTSRQAPGPVPATRRAGMRQTVSDRRIHISNWGPPTRYPSSSPLPPITAAPVRPIDSACSHPPPDLTLSQPTDPAHVPPCRPLSPIDVTRARHPARRISTQPACMRPPAYIHLEYMHSTAHSPPARYLAIACRAY